MKKQPLALLLLLSFAACNTPPVEDVEVVDENEVIENQETENLYSQTVDFLDTAEALSAVEIVENNRDKYQDPENAKLMLHMWKTGTFKGADYEGQSLVLVQESCDGPCGPAFFRYAVDEATDTWTLLSNYSTSAEAWLGGPMDAQDGSVNIPELEVPATLAGYDNDSVALLDAFSRLNANQFPENQEVISSMDGLTRLNVFEDPAFPMYFTAGGCLYGVSPDGVMARYTVLPNLFMATDKEGNFDSSVLENTEFNFTGKDGKSEEKTFSLTAGGCGLAWSCIDTYEPTDDEMANLEEVGTLDGRSVYQPININPREGLSIDYNNYDLEQRVYNAFDNYLMAKAYDLGEDPLEYKETSVETVQDFLALSSVFFIKMDNGSVTLTYESKYAPAAECGKPVIYLYPEKNTLVRVKVGIEEFTKTIPDYGTEGWTVLARASGLLTNIADKLNYPYLFWEGTSSETMDAGTTWTLAKEDVSTKLPKALLAMGLNEKESRDFMEFWQPKLEAVTDPYIEFSFVGKEVMDQIAPLTILPAPDQVLRLFMFYRGTTTVGLAMPTYKHEARHGFTAVEWGGILY